MPEVILLTEVYYSFRLPQCLFLIYWQHIIHWDSRRISDFILKMFYSFRLHSVSISYCFISSAHTFDLLTFSVVVVFLAVYLFSQHFVLHPYFCFIVNKCLLGILFYWQNMFTQIYWIVVPLFTQSYVIVATVLLISYLNTCYVYL